MLAELEGDPAVWGVGSAVGITGGWLPLILVSHEALVPSSPNIPIGMQTNLLDFMLGVPYANRVIATLRAWEPSPRTLVRVTTRPVAASRVGSGSYVREVLSSHAAGPARFATAGLPCRVGPSATLNGFITAGHLVSQVNALVEVAGEDANGQPAWIRGTVRHWSDPASNPPTGSWDYAVVVLDNGAAVDPVSHSGCQPAPSPPYVAFNVSLNGAVSPQRYGMVDAALNQHGDTTRQWLNCWSLGPSYLLDLGDSGTVALAAGQGARTVFGHFVGGQQWPGGQGLVKLYVQDLASCLAAGLGQFVTI